MELKSDFEALKYEIVRFSFFLNFVVNIAGQTKPDNHA